MTRFLWAQPKEKAQSNEHNYILDPTTSIV